MSMPRSAALGLGALGVAGLVLTSACSAKTEPATAAPSASSASSTAVASAGDQQHNPQDVTFAQQMIPHHQQAVEMSDMILGKTGIDPRVVTLAQQIKAAQDPEIQQMQGWLTQWGAPAMPGMGGMDHTGMGGMDHGGMGGMPGMGDMSSAGMMTAQDMEALKAAQGAEAGKLFLTQMIKHHQGAITMAQTEITAGQFQPAVALAKSIATSQQKEIDDMRALLATM